MNKRLKHILLCASMVALASCENDGYDTGDGSLSYLRADFVEAYTNSSSEIYKAVTDEDVTLTLASPLTVSWATEADAIYRALLYYDMSEEEIEPISISSVSVPDIVMEDEIDDAPTDPLYWDSSWISSNGRYINLGITVMLGAEDGTIGTQTIGMMCEGISYSGDGTCVVSLYLLHDQCDVPEYYSLQTYMSIPISYIPCELSEGDIVSLTVNTYSGEITKEFEI